MTWYDYNVSQYTCLRNVWVSKNFTSVSVLPHLNLILSVWIISCLDICVLANVSVSEKCLDSNCAIIRKRSIFSNLARHAVTESACKTQLGGTSYIFRFGKDIFLTRWYLPCLWTNTVAGSHFCCHFSFFRMSWSRWIWLTPLSMCRSSRQISGLT